MASLKPIVNWLMLFILLRISFASTEPDVEGTHMLNNCILHLRPCYSWSHVTCRNGNVISLSLASNEFSGTLSPSITKLKFLASLDFQDNSLKGVLPVYLANLTHLQNLNLANNNFRGPISNTWGQLSNLKHLVLRGNHISGDIPDSLANIVGLTELIPMQLFTVPTFNFTGTRLSCGSSLKEPCASGSSLRVSTKKSKLGRVRDVFVDVAGEDDCKISFGQLRRFSWREIERATNNFDESNIIGQGGFGRVYRGVLSDNVKIAVKRLTDYNSPGGEAAFVREVQLISVAVHRNLLRLIGFCTTSSERILVYPFMKNLSVAYRLRDRKPGEKGLDWPTRKRIAFGAAHGLEYLHEYCNPKIIHRDLKAANILLDDDFEPVLGDFGLAKLVDTKATHVTTQVRGTMGHIAPEYLSTGKSSEKTDVFGYGITLLELVTGQRAIDLARLEEEEDVLLLDHIKKLQRENRLDDLWTET
ncbi:hypothetical protein M0R45_005818 [Rubus argutus]|uniref:non-specific serine/threonine protein kinase n=1 Tax=Rubus argutus TaxID=59490 RepID=A0AAW1YPA0_RUBAR